MSAIAVCKGKRAVTISGNYIILTKDAGCINFINDNCIIKFTGLINSRLISKLLNQLSEIAPFADSIVFNTALCIQTRLCGNKERFTQTRCSVSFTSICYPIGFLSNSSNTFYSCQFSISFILNSLRIVVSWEIISVNYHYTKVLLSQEFLHNGLFFFLNKVNQVYKEFYKFSLQQQSYIEYTTNLFHFFDENK